MSKSHTPSIPNYSENYYNSAPPPQKTRGKLLSIRQKPQISSIPGISPKERNRYRVMLGDEILGDRLTLDEALELMRGTAK